jgi:hypothetical protein
MPISGIMKNEPLKMLGEKTEIRGITPREKILLNACCQYSIYDDRSRKLYYQLGGHGHVPIRYHPNTLYKLRGLGLVTDSSEGWKATEKGKQVNAA